LICIQEVRGSIPRSSTNYLLLVAGVSQVDGAALPRPWVRDGMPPSSIPRSSTNFYWSIAGFSQVRQGSAAADLTVHAGWPDPSIPRSSTNYRITEVRTKRMLCASFWF